MSGAGSVQTEWYTSTGTVRTARALIRPPPMRREHDRRGLVHERTTDGDNVEERGEVVAAARSGTGAERGVESADGAQCLGAERHVRARTETPRGVREQGIAFGTRGPAVVA